MPTPPGPVASDQNAPHAASTAGLDSRTPPRVQRGAPPSSVAQPGAPSQPNAGSVGGAQLSSGRATSVAFQASWWRSTMEYTPRSARSAIAASASARYASSISPGAGSTRDHE